MNGVSEAFCTMLEEPQTLIRPYVDEPDMDSYLSTPTRTTPFAMPPPEPSGEEDDPLSQPLEPEPDH